MDEQKTILVLDDSKLLLRWTKDVLEKEGYSVLTAETVFAARDLASKNPSLILMDVQFAEPYQEGVAAVKSLKRSEDTAHIPIVLYSGLEEDLLVMFAESSGAEGYICKTESEAALIQQVTFYMAETELTRNLEEDFLSANAE